MVTAMTMGQGEWGNSYGAMETAAMDQSQLQWQWGKRTGATAIAVAMALLGHWGSSDSDCCNGNGNGSNGAHDRSIVYYIAAQNVETGQWGDGSNRLINGNGERGPGHWGRGTRAGALGKSNRTAIAIAMATIDRSCFYRSAKRRQ
jgi:hypothetical protein